MLSLREWRLKEFAATAGTQVPVSGQQVPQQVPVSGQHVPVNNSQPPQVPSNPVPGTNPEEEEEAQVAEEDEEITTTVDFLLKKLANKYKNLSLARKKQVLANVIKGLTDKEARGMSNSAVKKVVQSYRNGAK